MPFCCLKRCALVNFFCFCFFWIPEFLRSDKTEGRLTFGDSARGKEVKDLSTSKLGDAARRAARELSVLAGELSVNTCRQRNLRLTLVLRHGGICFERE